MFAYRICIFSARNAELILEYQIIPRIHDTVLSTLQACKVKLALCHVQITLPSYKEQRLYQHTFIVSFIDLSRDINSSS